MQKKKKWAPPKTGLNSATHGEFSVRSHLPSGWACAGGSWLGGLCAYPRVPPGIKSGGWEPLKEAIFSSLDTELPAHELRNQSSSGDHCDRTSVQKSTKYPHPNTYTSLEEGRCAINHLWRILGGRLGAEGGLLPITLSTCVCSFRRQQQQNTTNTNCVWSCALVWFALVWFALVWLLVKLQKWQGLQNKPGHIAQSQNVNTI